jgi:hypothetical protein
MSPLYLVQLSRDTLNRESDFQLNSAGRYGTSLSCSGAPAKVRGRQRTSFVVETSISHKVCGSYRELFRRTLGRSATWRRSISILGGGTQCNSDLSSCK